MDSLNKQESINGAWKAMAESVESEGWRTINIDREGFCKAGMRLNDRMEAILFGFKEIRNQAGGPLPEGHGFAVCFISLPFPDHDRTWVALVRTPSGNPQMFSAMSSDILCFLEKHLLATNTESFGLFLGRVRAWQNFMRKQFNEMLSPEDETGLFGEIMMLQSLIDSGLPSEIAIQSWKGPYGGMQDFYLGTGALEVKTTTKTGEFIARIPSLLQLDNTLVNPIYLCATRLENHEDGVTLPELAKVVSRHFSLDITLESKFYDALLAAGLHFGFASSYYRRFRHVVTCFFVVSSDFPRLIPGNVHSAISKAIYHIDLQGLTPTPLNLLSILESTGVWS